MIGIYKGAYLQHDRIRTKRNGLGACAACPLAGLGGCLGCPDSSSRGLGQGYETGAPPMSIVLDEQGKYVGEAAKEADSGFSLGDIFGKIGEGIKSVFGTAKTLAPTAAQTWVQIEALKRGVPASTVLGKYPALTAGGGIGAGTLLVIGAVGLGIYLLVRKK